MATEVAVALIGACGSGIGAVIGIFANTKLINYRLKKLEEKVNAHNCVIERTYELEKKTDVLSEKINVANHRINDLEHI
jgi:hypothetical protein